MYRSPPSSTGTNAVDELLSFERHPALAVEDIYRLIVIRPSSLVYFRISRSDMSEGATNVSTRLKNAPPPHHNYLKMNASNTVSFPPRLCKRFLGKTADEIYC